ncbi:MAG: hypothetical protein ACK4VI_00315 [Alphaproteobacteria bacterium]
MTLFMSDNKGQVWEYASPDLNSNEGGRWRSMRGDFQAATKEAYQTGISFFHAPDFETLQPYIAAKTIINQAMAIWLDHGVITPSGDFYGVHKGQHEAFVGHLKQLGDHAPDRLARELRAIDLGAPWIFVSKNDAPKDVPIGATEAQRSTLQKIGYLEGDQIAYSGKLYADAFPDMYNPAVYDLVDVCFSLWDAYDAHIRENRASGSAHEAIGIENGFRAPC